MKGEDIWVIVFWVGVATVGGFWIFGGEPNNSSSSYKYNLPASVSSSYKYNTPTRTTNSGCHPNYSGCLKQNAGDYDCRGGSGNGPNYTGRVRVYGRDVFGLDRDGDGIGCE